MLTWLGKRAYGMISVCPSVYVPLITSEPVGEFFILLDMDITALEVILSLYLTSNTSMAAVPARKMGATLAPCIVGFRTFVW
jgi:hypothetical protein